MNRIAAYVVLILLAFVFASTAATWQTRVSTAGGGFDGVMELLSNPDPRYPSEPVQIERGRRIYSAACYACHNGIENLRPFTHGPWEHSPRDVYQLITWGHGIEFPHGFPYSGSGFDLQKDHPAFPSALDDNDRWAVSVYVASHDPSPWSSGDNANGRELFSTYCTSCHGPMGYGNGPLAGDLSPPPSNLRDTGWLAGQSNKILFWMIASGVRDYASNPEYPAIIGMPAWRSEIDAEDILDLVFYIRSFAYTTGELSEVGETTEVIEPDFFN